MQRRLFSFVITLCVAPLIVLAPTHTAHAADDEEPLEFTGTFTYTVDPAQGVIHADAVLDVKDLNKGRPGYCWDGFYIPVPASATNIVNLASLGYNNSGQLVGERPGKAEIEAIDGSTSYMRLLVSLKICIYNGRKVHNHLTFDILGGAPRSTDPARVNASYVGFDALAMGRPSGVTTKVVLPSTFEMDHVDDHWTSATANGATTYSLSPEAQDDYPDTYLGARNDSALEDISVDTGTGQSFNIMHWPNDVEWGQFVADQVERGVPALSEAVGVDWPIDGETQVREAYSNYFDGYAGWFDPDSNEMEIGDDLDQEVVLHELSHAWFNDNWFSDRWLSEGFAEAYAALVMDQLGGDPADPVQISTTDPGAVALEMWADPFFDTEGTDDTEQYGYTASHYIISTLIEEIGVDKMREVLRLVDSGVTIYAGDTDAEVWNEETSWRDFLDLVEVIGGSTKARDLIERFVVSPHSADSLDVRDAAREAYATLDARGAEWAAPVAVRKSMDDWNFTRFDDLAAAADATLDLRDQLAELCDGVDIELPTDLEAAYEEAAKADEIVAAQNLADEYITAALALTDATDSNNGSHGIFGAIGLIGSDADSELQAAREAFTNGDPEGAIDHAHKVVGIVDDASGQGLLRIGLALLVVLVVVGLVWFLRRRKARKHLQAIAAAEAAAAAPLSELPTEPTDPVDSAVTVDPAPQPAPPEP